jgi:hypothetical protein
VPRRAAQAVIRCERQKRVPICSAFEKPSDGLEPSTPPYHGSLGGSRPCTRDHSRLKFLLQIGPVRTPEVRRETSRVSLLMCPFCVRGLMPNKATRRDAAATVSAEEPRLYRPPRPSLA